MVDSSIEPTVLRMPMRAPRTELDVGPLWLRPPSRWSWAISDPYSGGLLNQWRSDAVGAQAVAARRNDRDCALLRRPILSGTGLRSLSSRCAAAVLCRSDDSGRSFRTGARPNVWPASRAGFSGEDPI